MTATSRKENESRTENTTTGTTTTNASSLSYSIGDDSSSNYHSYQYPQLQQSQVIDRAIDHTKNNVRRSIEEARREIPEYAQSVTDYHQQAMDSAQEITNNYLDSQKDIINSIESTWTSYLETVYWWLSPRKLAEMYAQTVSSIADNSVSASRIWNKVTLANMDASKAYIYRTREASKDISRINVNTARTFERTSSQIRDGNNSNSSSDNNVSSSERKHRLP
jgi:hypothetical protein